MYYDLMYKVWMMLQVHQDVFFIYKNEKWKIENSKLFILDDNEKWKERNLLSFNHEELKELEKTLKKH
ncbi:MAG: hypothetical protein ABF289_15185 [Clostridiales bacterium]